MSAGADNGIARSAGSASDAATTRRTDAVTGGIVRTGECAAERSEPGGDRLGKPECGTRAKGGSTAGPQGEAESAGAKGATALQAASSLFRATADAAGDDDDDGDLGEDAVEDPAQRTAGAARRAWRRKRAGTAEGAGETQRAATAKTAAGQPARAAGASKVERAKRRMQSRRTWLRARETAAAKGAAEETAKAAARKGAARTIASAASSAAAPVAGAVLGVLAVVLAALLASQLASSLFGFWDNEASQGTGTLTGVEQQIAAALKGYGFSDESTAAVLGNLKAESAMDPASDEVMDGMFNHAYERACGDLPVHVHAPRRGRVLGVQDLVQEPGEDLVRPAGAAGVDVLGELPGHLVGALGDQTRAQRLLLQLPRLHGRRFLLDPRRVQGGRRRGQGGVLVDGLLREARQRLLRPP